MEVFSWDNEKNNWLIQHRGISFERIVFSIANNGLLDKVRHPNQERYPNQSILIVEVENYAYVIPCIEQVGEIFLKTIIPSRKATRDYLRKSK